MAATQYYAVIASEALAIIHAKPDPRDWEEEERLRVWTAERMLGHRWTQQARKLMRLPPSAA
jgi:hypothetical protein